MLSPEAVSGIVEAIYSLLTLERPLIWLDVETHDKAPEEKSYIVELGFTLIYPQAEKKEPRQYVTFIQPPPNIVISPGATEVHHITNEDIRDRCYKCRRLLSEHLGPECARFVPVPTWREIGPHIAKGFTNCDFGGYNVRFDLRVIYAEMLRIQEAWTYTGARILDPLWLWRLVAGRTLTDAVREFLNREPTEAHRALGDANDAMEVFPALMKRFPNLPRDLDKLHAMCFADGKKLDPDGRIVWKGDEAMLNFGQHNGWLLKAVPKRYLQFMLDGGFSPEVKEIVRQAQMGVYPSKPKEIV